MGVDDVATEEGLRRGVHTSVRIEGCSAAATAATRPTTTDLESADLT